MIKRNIKFKELSNGDKFLYKQTQYMKIKGNKAVKLNDYSLDDFNNDIVIGGYYKEVYFDDIKIGQYFEFNGAAYIKTGYNCAYSIVFDKNQVFEKIFDFSKEVKPLKLIQCEFEYNI